MMKKIFLLSILAGAMTLTSCRKDRTCTCTETDIDTGGSNVTTSVQTVGHAKKREAKRLTNCYSYKDTRTDNGNVTQITTDCKLD